jgi:RHS repeat-associated protein
VEVGRWAGSAQLTRERYKYDDFGRLIEQRWLLPNGTESVRQTAYKAMGWKVSESEAGTNAPGGFTQYLAYDPFGRPGRIRPPEGSGHDVLLYYSGVRKVDRLFKLGTGVSPPVTEDEGAEAILAETQQGNTEIYDRQGRLFRLKGPSNPDGTTATSTYFYDPSGAMNRVQQATASGTQNRYFTVDGRGFLLAESHPEKGTGGNGTVTYAGYDSRGHAGRRNDAGTLVDFAYDPAERLVAVSEGSAGGRPLKTFTYGTANAAGDRKLGKLGRAQRYNYVDVGTPGSPAPYTVEVEETYTYGGVEGRTSARATDFFIGGAQTAGFTQSFGYDSLGDPASLGYPQCVGCRAESPRMVAFTRTRGLLTGVSGYTGVGGITYHANGMIAQVVHANGVADVWTNDDYGRPRPKQIRSTGVVGGLDWDSREYGYDGVGNVVKEGAAYFLVDPVSRVVASHLLVNRLGTSNRADQSYSYDAFGNILSITTLPLGSSTPVTRLTPTSAATNRLSGAGTTYDGRGNLTAWNGATYRWGALDKMWRMTSGTEDWVYVYTADDERLFGFQVAGEGQVNRFTLRDLGGQVLREYIQDRAQGYAWHVERDYVYRDGALLAAETPQGTRHFHLDHLGSPRLVTDGAGNKKGFHAYFPFGEEASVATQDAERMKFTGHERDLAATTGANPTADDLDYMHARFCSPLTGRFLSVDPEIAYRAGPPQAWNRYHYARGNPLLYVDPDGRKDTRTTSDIAILEDPDVLAAVAEITELTGLDRPLQNRQEAGAVVADEGGGDYDISGGVVTQGNLASVGLALRKTGNGRYLTLSKKPIAATLHSHPGTGPVTVNGKSMTLFGGAPSTADKTLVQSTGTLMFILNAEKNLIKVTYTQGKFTTTKVLTKKDYDEFLARARFAAVSRAFLFVGFR